MAKETLTEVITVAQGEENKPPKTQSVLPWMAENGIFIFTALLIIGAAVFVDGFASLVNITDVFHRAAPIGIVAAGMTFVVISGNYLDLSVVAQVATSAVIFLAVSNLYGVPLAMLAAFGVAILYALVNGIAVGYFKANAVIVTLATTYIGIGVLRYFFWWKHLLWPRRWSDQGVWNRPVGPGALLRSGTRDRRADFGLRSESNQLWLPGAVLRCQ